VKEALKLVTTFTTVVKDVVGAIGRGVDAFKAILNTDYSLKEMVDDFITAFEEIPDKVDFILVQFTLYPES